MFVKSSTLLILLTVVACVATATTLPSVEGKTNDTANGKNGDLLLLQFLFRHGDRTPIVLYKTDRYNESQFKEGLGALTNRGKQRKSPILKDVYVR